MLKSTLNDEVKNMVIRKFKSVYVKVQVESAKSYSEIELEFFEDHFIGLSRLPIFISRLVEHH